MMGLDEGVDLGAEKKQRALTSGVQAAKQKQKLHLPQGAASLEYWTSIMKMAPFFRSNTACLEMNLSAIRVERRKQKPRRKPRAKNT